MNIVAFIPARMGSSRFPGKPLADILGLPMVIHVALRTGMAQSLSNTVVATCDQCISDVCAEYNVPAIMTGSAHERCSDRVAEAVGIYEKNTGSRVDIAVMVQGDEPLVTPEMIDAALVPMLEDEDVNVVNLMAEMDEAEFEDPNEVKVVTDVGGNALYFSREPIPSRKKNVPDVPMRKQVCVIPFRRDALLHFNALPEGTLERIESVDMLRFLEHGEAVRMVFVRAVTKSVDTPDDLKRVIQLMGNDALLPGYLRSLQSRSTFI